MIAMGSKAISDPPLPFITYNYSTSLQENISILWWNVNETSEEIVFELHIQTTGWIALGISPGKRRWLSVARCYRVSAIQVVG